MNSNQGLLSDIKNQNLIFQRELKSKKNKVAYVLLDSKPRVVKLFLPGYKNNLQNEYNVLKKGYSKLNVPTPFEIDNKNNILILSYISGTNLCDVINSDKKEGFNNPEILRLLAIWFFKFHEFFKTDNYHIIRGDSSLRNFIYNTQIWGVDFEESRKGKPEEDIAEMCVSILTTDPMFTADKVKLCKKFISFYEDISKKKLTKIETEISYSLLNKIQFRENQSDIFKKYATQIREKGLDSFS